MATLLHIGSRHHGEQICLSVSVISVSLPFLAKEWWFKIAQIVKYRFAQHHNFASFFLRFC